MKTDGIVKGMLVIAVLFWVVVPYAGHAIPQKINYQGYLTTREGMPINGTIPMVFSLYNVPSSGTALWTEQQNVTVINGIYNVSLGDTAFISLPFDVPYYLGITVGTDPEMTPRKALTSVGYAFRAMTADVIGAHTHSGGDITSGTVAEPRIDAAITRDSEVMTIVKANDGTGSGLDADLLDGFHETAFFRLDRNEVVTGVPTFNGGISASTPPFHVDSSYKVTSFNADLLDGQHGTDFAGTSHNHYGVYVNRAGDTMTGVLNLPPNGLLAGTNQLVLSEGNVGIGTAPTLTGAKVEVSDLTRIQGSTWPSSGKGMELAYNSSLHKGYVQVYDRSPGGGWGDLYLGDGNVGIGANPPQQKLDVNGKIRAKTGYGDSILLGGDTLANDVEIRISAPLERNWLSLRNEQISQPVGLGTGNIRINGAGNGLEFPDGTKITTYRGFPRPNFDSGWNNIAPGQTFTLTHNVGVDVNKYFVDLQFKSLIPVVGITNYGIGGFHFWDDNKTYWHGAHYDDLTTTTISVHRNDDDFYVDQFRVRIWLYE